MGLPVETYSLSNLWDAFSFFNMIKKTIRRERDMVVNKYLNYSSLRRHAFVKRLRYCLVLLHAT